MSAQKTERLLNLVIALLSTRQLLSKAKLRTAVPQYADCPNAESFDRMFERDKDELRDLGIPLTTGIQDTGFTDEPGYRIDRAAYAMPDISFTPDELAVLGLASRVWQQASLAAPASRALLKLQAAGVEPDASGLVGVEPRVRTSEPAFEGVYAAVRDRRAITFPYRTPGRAGVAERHLQPWGIVSRNGRWYVVGHDLDRGATRVFRLSRVAGAVSPVGPRGAVVAPDGIDLRAQVASFDPPELLASARLLLRPGSGVRLRRQATDLRLGTSVHPHEGWDEIRVPYADHETLAGWLAGYGADVVVLEPPEVREAVVRRLRGVLKAVEMSSR